MTKNELIEASRIAETGRLEAERKLKLLRRAVIESVIYLQGVDLKPFGVIRQLEEALTESMP